MTKEEREIAEKAKAKNGAGSIERRNGIWWARISLPDGRRKRIPIPKSERMTKFMAREKAAFYAEEVRAGRIVFDVEPDAGDVSPAAILTVRQLGDAWTSGQLFKTYGSVNKLRVKATAETDAWTMKKHVYGVKTRGPKGPEFGDLRASDVTSDDVAAVMAAHSKELAAQTRMHTYQRLRRLFDLAIFPCRLRKEGDNPVTRYVRPERDPEKLFCFLYPTELLALLRGTNDAGEVVIPLGRRVLYAIACYTGQRSASLFALRWKHADFEHGTLASFKTKTGRAQYFVADRGLMAILEPWRARLVGPDGDVDALDEEPIVRDVFVGGRVVRRQERNRKRLASVLRSDLKAVGVKRALLFEEDAPNVEPLRFHDLRSTFCTWARRQAKSDAWISERTGHELSGDMISRYDRGAQTLGDLAYEPFPDISRAIPELVSPAPLATALATESNEDEAEKNESPALPPAYIVGARGFEPPTPRSRTECATRLRYAPRTSSRSFASAKARAAAPLLMRRRGENRPRLMTVPRPSVKPASLQSGFPPPRPAHQENGG